MLYLIHKKFDGEPQGIWAEDGTNFYVPGSPLEREGALEVSYRRDTTPWEVFVEEKSDAVNHRTWWTEYVSDAGAEEALGKARDEFFSLKSRSSIKDK